MIEFGQNQQKLGRRISAAVDRKQTDLIESGTDIDVPGYGWIALSGSEKEQRTLISLNQGALSSIVKAKKDARFIFNDRNNVIHNLNADQVIDLVALGTDFLEAVFLASWMTKQMAITLQDVEDSPYWPAPTTAPTNES